jgi:M6 family metalloprotease-like protein
VTITGDVFPQGENDAYQLSEEMGYYNPNTTDAEINKGIAQLFIDAVQTADEDDDIVFDNYDLIVVFHAGVGRDIAFDYDPTPQDISSLYVTLDFMQKWISSAVQGAPADSGYITKGIILPETENQEGEQIALTGMFVSNIGTHLGLYDLFSPSKQRTGVGRFGLMDAGLLNLNGLAPAPPGAYSRKKLGWTQPQIITQPTNNIEITRYGLDNPESAEIVQIPINDNEYYLLEFRGDYKVNIDSLYVDMFEDREEYLSYLEVLKTYYDDQLEFGESGVLLSMPDYDWGLPGAGILIWHVDERVIAEKGPTNSINDDSNYRGVDIEEADGSQDIGYIYNFLEPGYQTELGWFADFWYSNRSEDLEDFELYENKFSTNTSPNTRSNLNNAKSYITLENFSANTSDEMTLDFKRDIFESGYPLSLFDSSATLLSTIAGTLEDHNVDFIFALDSKGDIYAINTENEQPMGLYDNEYLIGGLDQIGNYSSLALINSNADERAEMLVISSGNKVKALNLIGEGVSGLAPIQFETNLPGDAVGPVVQAGSSIYIPCVDKKIYRLDFTGQVGDPIETEYQVKDIAAYPGVILPNFNFRMSFAAIAHLITENEYNLITYDEEKQTFYIHNPDGSEHANFSIESDLTSQFILADMDANNVPDIVFTLKDGIYAYSVEGFPISGFPIKPKFITADSLIGTPLALDVNNDGLLDLIYSTKKGQVLACSITGQTISEYQLSTGGSLSVNPMVIQLDFDEELELVAITDSGNVYAWQLEAPYNSENNIWLQANYNSSNNAYIEGYTAYQSISAALMPPKKVYNYPNPNKGDFTNIRYYLNEPATVTIRILDAAGALVDEFEGPGFGQTDNEIPWNVSNIASGVYICQVEAKSQSKTEKQLIKIMVIH